MSAKEVTPQEAQALVENEGYVHLDVRTEAEFEAGHPAGSYNIPVMFRDPVAMQMVPNPDFLSQVEANFPKDTKFVVGCRSGGRSARAQMMMLEAGYGEVINQLHGWEARRTPDGQVLPGWSMDDNLPKDMGNPEGRSFAALRDQAKNG
jgi:rhodanese-related sulfurtransferase